MGGWYPCKHITLVLLFQCVTLITSITVPRKPGTPITYSGGYLGYHDPFYFLTAYSSVNFRQSTRFRTFYNASVAEYPLANKNHTWICYLDDPDIRLDYITPGPRLSAVTKLVFVAGTAYRNEGTNQALFVASVLVSRKSAKIKHTFESKPMRTVQISAISAFGKSLVVCGAMLKTTHAKNETSAFAFEFDDSVNFNSSLIEMYNGTSLDRCSGVSHTARGSVQFILTRYNTSVQTTGEATSRSQITALSANATDDGRRPQLWKSSVDETVPAISDLNVSHVEPVRIIADRGTLFVVLKARTRKQPPTQVVVLTKFAEASGVIFYARVFQVSSEVTRVDGPVVARDNYVYLLIRAAKLGKYSSAELRLSMWGEHDATHDRSSALWESDNTRGPAVALTFSLLDNQVKALGVIPKSSITTDGARKQSRLYQTLPLSPTTNDAKDAATPVGSVGSQFLRITFVLSVQEGGKRALQIAVDMLAHLLRVLPKALVLESKAKKKPTIRRSLETRERFALTLQGEDLNGLEEKLIKHINEFAVKRRNKKETVLEKSSQIGRVVLTELKTESRGVSNTTSGEKKGRSAADLAEDLVRNTTITAAGIAVGLVLLVGVVVIITKIRHAMKPPGSESDIMTDPDLQPNSDGNTFVTLRSDGTLAFTSSLNSGMGGSGARYMNSVEPNNLVLPEDEPHF